MTNIAAIKTTSRTLEILDPRDMSKKLGIRLTLVSMDDERVLKVKRKITDQRMRLDQRSKVFKAEEIEENRTELYSATIVNWHWYAQDEVKDDDGNVISAAIECPDYNGEVLDFNIRNVKKILGNNDYSWFLDQIMEALGETADFFEKSEQN